MTLKTRLILLGVCAVLFFVVTPFIVLYSLGYRVDFETWQIRGTGGIYVYAQPAPDSVTIDSVLAEKTGLFSSAVFTQNLTPGTHHVEIAKEGYYGYQKELLVIEKQVAKLENVMLFKQKLDFATVESAVDYVSASPNETTLLLAKIAKEAITFDFIDLNGNQPKTIVLPIANGKILNAVWPENANAVVINVSGAHYLLDLAPALPIITPLPALGGATQITFSPQNSEELFFIKNKDLYTTAQFLPLIKNVVTYTAQNQTITWLSADGFLYEGNLLGTAPVKISAVVFPIKTTKTYELEITQGLIFLQENTALLKLDPTQKTFELLHANVKDFKASPNNQTIAYVNESQLLISFAEQNHSDIILLDAYTQTITDFYWLNDSYLVISAGDNIIISEIDPRGTINKVTLPATLSLLQGQALAIKTPQILLRQQDKKLYLFTQKEVIVSERLVP